MTFNETCAVGALGIVWSVLWLFFTADTPSQHPRIDPKERDYIEQSQGLLAQTQTHVSQHVLAAANC